MKLSNAENQRVSYEFRNSPAKWMSSDTWQTCARKLNTRLSLRHVTDAVNTGATLF